MKKLAISALSVLLILSFISCGSKPTEDTQDLPVEPTVEEQIEQDISQVDNTLALANMDSSRQAAIDSNAEAYAPYQFNTLESKYADLKAKADNGEDISAASTDLAKRYQALTAYVNALQAKEKIEETEKISILQNVYDKACTDLADYEALFDDSSATGDQLLEKASGAYAGFTTVLHAIYKQVAKDERAKALEAKKNADSVKAGVAQKTTYNEAADLFKKGDSLYSMQNSAKAYDYYKESYEIFSSLFEDITEKRAAALAAIEAAKKSVEESAAVAEQADLESPITGNIEGIEDEDAVLLEEEDYADPEDAEADLAEDIDDGTIVDQIQDTANNLLNAMEDAK